MKSSVSLLILSLFFLLQSTFAQSDTAFVYESFDYPAFNPLECKEGGKGWTSPWTRVTGDDLITRAENLPVAGSPMRTGSHCAIEFVNAGLRYNRSIDLIRDDGQVLWAGVIMEFMPGNNANNVGNITLLRNGNQVFTFGQKYGSQQFGVIWPPNVTNYNTNVNTQGLHWVVLKIQFSGDNQEEQAWLWIDPDPLTEPQAATADLTVPKAGAPSLTLNFGFDAVQIKAEGVAPLRMAMDELMMGRSFEAIKPFSATTAIESPLISDFSVFPNPASDLLQLSFDLAQAMDLNLHIISMDGRVVYTEKLSRLGNGPHTHQVDLASAALAEGCYVLQVEGEGLMMNKLLIIR